MSRGRGSSKAMPSLFPFMSVLVCVIGALMFLALAVAPSSLVSAAGTVLINLVGIKNPEREPSLLECLEDRAFVRDGEYIFSLEEEKAAVGRDAPDSAFTRFLEDLAQEGREPYFVFLVRPSGLDIFRHLRAVLDHRNRTRCTKSVPVSESPDETRYDSLPKVLRSRISYNSGQLSYLRVMTEQHRDIIKTLFKSAKAKGAVARLYENSRSSTDWIDYGFELLPGNWKVKSVHMSGGMDGGGVSAGGQGP